MKRLYFKVCSCLLFSVISCSRMPNIEHTGCVINVPLEAVERTDHFDYFSVYDSLTTIILNDDSVESIIGNIEDIHIDDDWIFIRDIDVIHVFDLDGNFIRNIGRRGRGRGEYLKLMDFDLNRQKKELTIYDQGMHRFLIYDYYGNFVRQFEYEYIVREFATLPNGDYIIYRPDYEKDAHRGLFQIDSNGNIKKQLLQFDNYMKSYMHSGKNICRINDGLLSVKALDCMNSIYHVTEDTIYEAYEIVTDVKIDKGFIKTDVPTYEDLEKYDYYHLTEMFETERHLEFNLLSTINWAKTYYDKKTNKTYRLYADECPDLFESRPSDLYEHYMISCENGINIGYLTAAAIVNDSVYHSLFPDITEKSNPVLFYMRVKDDVPSN